MKHLYRDFDGSNILKQVFLRAGSEANHEHSEGEGTDTRKELSLLKKTLTKTELKDIQKKALEGDENAKTKLEAIRKQYKEKQEKKRGGESLDNAATARLQERQGDDLATKDLLDGKVKVAKGGREYVGAIEPAVEISGDTQKNYVDFILDETNPLENRQAKISEMILTGGGEMEAALEKIKAQASAEIVDYIESNAGEKAGKSSEGHDNGNTQVEKSPDDLATENALRAQDEKIEARKLAEKKEAEAKKTEEEAARIAYINNMKEIEAANKKAFEEAASKASAAKPESEELNTPPEVQPGSKAPKSFEGPIVERPDVIATKKAEAERLAQIEAERNTRIIETYGQSLKEAVKNGNKAEILKIEKELTGNGQRSEVISRIQQALMVFDSPKEDVPLLENLKGMLDRGLFRRLVRQHLRLLSQGGPYPQENLPELLYPTKERLTNAITKGDAAEIQKIDQELSARTDIREGAQEASIHKEIIRKKQVVVEDLSEKELLRLLALAPKPAGNDKQRERALATIAKRRLDTLPKTA